MIIPTRICVRRDTTSAWNAHPAFIPLKGEAIVYTDRSQRTDESGHTVDVPGIKIGDGKAYLIDLPFIGSESESASILAELERHEADAAIHTCAEEKSRWDEKITCDIHGETLILI